MATSREETTSVVPSSDTTKRRTGSRAKPADKSPQGYRITPTAEAELLEISAEIHVAPAALVDLAVREWCRGWRQELPL